MIAVTSSLAALWTIAHSMLYGFHISSLNGVQEAVTCPDQSKVARTWGLRDCLDLEVRLPTSH